MPRVKDGFRAGLKLVWTLSFPLFLLYFFAGRYLVYIFLDAASETAVSTGVQLLRILAPFYFVVSAKLVADGILRGAGMMKMFMISTFTDLILRVALSKLLSGVLQAATGIWCAWPIGWAAGTALSILFYRTGPWQTARQEATEG